MSDNFMNDNRIIGFIRKYRDFFACAGILFFALFLIRSAFYGTSTPDESFYLTIPYRIIKGDLFLVDEWHASQFSAFLLYLPMKLFLLINNNTEGIILYFRCLFVLCQTLVSYYTFFKLKRYGTFPAFLSAVIFLLYVTETVNMLDYYTMSLMGFQVVTLVLFSSDKLTPVRLIFSGIVFACVVVAQPFNCFIYFIYTIIVIISAILKNKKLNSDYFSLRSWAYITVGIFSVAVVFFIFVFSRMTVSEFISNFGNIFGGHDHTLPFSADTGKTDMFSYITIIKTLLRIAPVGFYVSIILIFSLICNKKRLKNRNLLLLVSLIGIIVLVVENILILKSDLVATLFRPYILFVFTLIAILLTKKKDNNLVCVAVSGIVYIIFLGLISQALDFVGVIGLVVSNTALAPSLRLLHDEIKSNKVNNEKKSSKNLLTKTLSAVCVFVFVFDITSGVAIKLSDDTLSLANMNTDIKAEETLNKGPMKGVKVSASTADIYYQIISDTEDIKKNSCEKVLIANLAPWIYFCFDESPATFTTWYIEQEFDLYDDYYTDAERIPQCVFVLNKEYYSGFNYTQNSDEYKNFFSEMFNSKITNGKAGYILYTEKPEF